MNGAAIKVEVVYWDVEALSLAREHYRHIRMPAVLTLKKWGWGENEKRLRHATALFPSSAHVEDRRQMNLARTSWHIFHNLINVQDATFLHTHEIGLSTECLLKW